MDIFENSRYLEFKQCKTDGKLECLYTLPMKSFLTFQIDILLFEREVVRKIQIESKPGLT
jgi:hypothetical protein